MSTPTTIRLLMPDKRVQTLPLDEYLRDVVPIEMSPSWPLEALKAQAVAARTYALAMAQSSKHTTEGADLCTETHCQAYREGQRHERTDRAVAETAGQVLRYQGPVALYQGKLAYTHFSAGCGGQTLSAEEWAVLKRPVPYLRSVACPCGRPVKGNSHRVGMCQHGAERMAQDGATYDRILAHYYTDTALDPAAPARPASATLSSTSPLLGPPSGSRDPLAAYLKRTLPDGHEYTARDVDIILELYWRIGQEEGVDPYLAAMQALYDTGGLQSPDAARPHRNPARLGQGGAPGGVQSFPDWEASVRAHIAHLKGRGPGKTLTDLRGPDYAERLVAHARLVHP